MKKTTLQNSVQIEEKNFSISFITFGFGLISTPNMALANGVNDVSESVRYANDGRVIGDVAEDIQDSDDDSQLIQAPWPMNFFGRTYDGLCVTSNGTISPVVYANASCDDSYDDPMADLAESADAPLIAAFSNDNDLGNAVRDWESVVSTITVDANTDVVSVTTAGNHGISDGSTRSIYVVDSLFDNGNTQDWRTDEYWFHQVTVTVTSPNSFTFDGSSARGYSGSYTPNFPSALTTSPITVDRGWVWDQSSANQNGIDDGVGKVNTVYIGETTIDGRDAWVYTNYRSVTYEDQNPQILTNTFQIVLIKRSTINGSTRGFDFDIEYNFGAVMDGGDGYSAANANCDPMNSGCRTGVGLADWDPVGEVADVYELFAQTPSRELVDWYSSGMTSNRLNSTINGRYSFSMVGGVVQDFAVPVMDGSGAVVSRPTVASPTDPVPSEAGIDQGQSSLLEDGIAVSVSVTRNQTNNGLIYSAGNFVLTLAGLRDENTPLPLDSNGNLIFKKEGLISTSGVGFAPNSPVKVYAYSNPTYLGVLYTDSFGTFSGSLEIPSELAPGLHNIQVIGYDADNKVKVLTVGVFISETGEVLAITGFNFVPYGYLALFMILLGIYVLGRSRNASYIRP